MNQRDALDTLKMGHNVYLTGAAGSGKTYVLNKYIEYLKKNKVGVGITASTGIAATHINGVTIHSWCGIGIKDALTEEDITDLVDNYDLRMKFWGTKVLVIDEISMLHAYRLDMIDRVCRAFKNKPLPFGGLQIIFCGDFFQLPPVTRGMEDGSFAYKSTVWQEMDLKTCYLSEQHRQSDDSLLQILDDIRGNKVNDDTLNFIESRYEKEPEGFATSTKLYTHNIDVDAINSRELSKINEPEKSYQMTGEGDRELVRFLRKSCLAPETLSLKIGAVVMFVKNNFDKGFVNGTLGKVVGFEKESNYPIVEIKSGVKITVIPENWIVERNDVTIASITQIPLRLAWAITIHKSQGMSLDAVEIDLSKSFVPGMGYVALSRARTLTGIKLIGMNNMALKINSEVFAMDVKLKENSEKHEDYLLGMDEKEKKKRQEEFTKSISR